MQDIKGLEWTFDTVAPIYAKLRPGYVKELYQRIFDFIPIRGSSNVLEVGIGGAQATLPILQTGCRLTAVEYGAHFSELCREKFKDYRNFSVITGRFEEVGFDSGAYDLIFSASAFHWIPEEIGYSKVFSLLKSGGAFARFANHPFVDKGRKELSDEIQKLYAIYMPSASKPAEYTEEMAKARAEIARRYGFEDIQWELYHRTRTFSAAEYITLLGTYSDHIALEEQKRTEFFSKIEQAINRYGGEITLYDTIDLQLARKP
ncbi:MAG: class I SAM-dependent methyltransferase [Provencibacterium sp.]|nr:class I SAM-dependent methyltransferase [Provencibacterium sp.]